MGLHLRTGELYDIRDYIIPFWHFVASSTEFITRHKLVLGFTPATKHNFCSHQNIDWLTISFYLLPGFYGHCFVLTSLIVSHQDNDHRGGVKSIQQEYIMGKILSSYPLPGSEKCQAG